MRPDNEGSQERISFILHTYVRALTYWRSKGNYQQEKQTQKLTTYIQLNKLVPITKVYRSFFI